MTGFVGAFISKFNSSASKNVVSMIEAMGEDLLIDAVGGGALGTFISAFFDYHSKLDKARRRDAKKQLGTEERAEKREEKKSRAQYRREHQAWLEQNRWRFNWQSQPRQPAGIPEGGEWRPGRYSFMAEEAKPISRSQLRRRNAAVRAYRARRKELGETRFRSPVNSSGVVSSWGGF